MAHKAGFVNIIGSPNVGKSTLLNSLLKEDLCIISPKAQTTRHRIFGFYNEENLQIVFSDTPGFVDAKYKLQETMRNAIEEAVEDADIFILLTDIYEKKIANEKILEKIKNSGKKILVLINKIDLLKNPEFLEKKVATWHEAFPEAEILPISALKKENTHLVLEKIKSWLPEHPAYFDKETLSDRNVRFFVSEMIREQIFLQYEEEVPYCCEVFVEEYIQKENIIAIRAQIAVARESQKGILLGKGGSAMKKLGMAARFRIEEFLKQRIYLTFHIKVDKDWRENVKKLKKYGYIQH